MVSDLQGDVASHRDAIKGVDFKALRTMLADVTAAVEDLEVQAATL